MKLTRDVALIEYSQKVDFLNHITHAAAAVAALFGASALISKAAPLGAKAVASCVVYSITLLCVYSFSAVYHALPQGEKRRKSPKVRRWHKIDTEIELNQYYQTHSLFVLTELIPF